MIGIYLWRCAHDACPGFSPSCEVTRCACEQGGRAPHAGQTSSPRHAPAGTEVRMRTGPPARKTGRLGSPQAAQMAASRSPACASVTRCDESCTAHWTRCVARRSLSRSCGSWVFFFLPRDRHDPRPLSIDSHTCQTRASAASIRRLDPGKRNEMARPFRGGRGNM